MIGRTNATNTARQEKTVTAGTSAVTVTPDSGKLLSKVTVNPTPSQTKSATPSTSAQTITPDSGKLLSSVSVAAMPTGAMSDISVDSAGLITSQIGTSGYLASGTKKTKQLTTKGATTYTPGGSAQTIAAGTYLTGAQTISAVPTETKSVTPSTSAQTVTPSSGKYLSSVSVGAISTETKTVTAGTSATSVTPTSGKYLSKVTVNPTPSQSKTATPSTSEQTITPDSGKLLSSVVVEAMAGVTQATPDITVSEAGLITASATQSAGYVSAGTKSATKQLTTQAAKTITPSSSSQTAVAKGVYTTGAVTVAAVPTETKTATPSTSAQDITPSSGKFLSKVTVNAMASGAMSDISVSSSGLITSQIGTSGYLASGTKKTKQLTTKGATTITPSTTNQTVASGTYLTGTLTVAGDANLVPEKIAAGETIFGKVGTYDNSHGQYAWAKYLASEKGIVKGAFTPSVVVAGYGTAVSQEVTINYSRSVLWNSNKWNLSAYGSKTVALNALNTIVPTDLDGRYIIASALATGKTSLETATSGTEIYYFSNTELGSTLSVYNDGTNYGLQLNNVQACHYGMVEGEFEEFLVSNDVSAYPDGEFESDYFYEKIKSIEGVAF